MKEARTANIGLPQWGLTWLIQVQCFYQSFCLVDSEVLRNLHLRVAAKLQLTKSLQCACSIEQFSCRRSRGNWYICVY